jgi:predicted dehydrogenase
MPPIDRRHFLSRSARGAAALAAAAALPSRVLGANDRVVLALIGAGGRGRQLARDFASRKDAEVALVCDLHEERRDAAVKELAARQRRPPQAVQEMQRVFDRKDVDAVIVATPDHWHALATVRACQAGKDVYVEKPPSHNLWESRQMVEAARRHGRVVQVGTQNRSAPYNHAARDYIKSGKLGAVHLCKVYNLKPGGPFKLPPDGRAPAGLDWEAWLGPAPSRPYNAAIFQGGWHRYWAYCGGDLGDDGIHQLDLALMLLGDPPLPRAVYGLGGRYAFQDDQEVPDTQVAVYELPKLVLTFELTGYPPYMDKIAQDVRDGDLFPYWPQCATRIELYGSKGLMYVGRHGGGWQVFGKAPRPSRPGELIAQAFGRPADRPHQDNFLACVRSRQRPSADIAIGHRSVTLVHLGNIAHRVGNTKLVYDAENETFVGNDAANKLRRGTYRKGYEVPESV